MGCSCSSHDAYCTEGRHAGETRRADSCQDAGPAIVAAPFGCCSLGMKAAGFQTKTLKCLLKSQQLPSEPILTKHTLLNEGVGMYRYSKVAEECAPYKQCSVSFLEINTFTQSGLMVEPLQAYCSCSSCAKVDSALVCMLLRGCSLEGL